MINRNSINSFRTAFRPSRKSLGPLMLCLVVVAVFVFVFFLPRGLEIESLDQQIAERSSQLQAQQELHPVYKELRQIMAEPLPVGLESFFNHAEPTLKLEETESRLRALAETEELDVRHIRPDAAALARDGVLLVDCSMSGETHHLWSFLRNLGAHPWLLDVQNLEISSGQTGEEFRLRLLIAMEGQ